MDRSSEYEASGARPRRRIRPPGRLADYEVNQLGYMQERWRRDVETPQQEGEARMTPLNSTYGPTSPSYGKRRDAFPSHEDWCYDSWSLQRPQEDRLAPSLTLGSSQAERLQGYAMPRYAVQSPSNPYQDLGTELEDIRRERSLLQQSQQRMSSDLAELRALRADMRQLVAAVQHLQLPPPPDTSELHMKQPPPPVLPADEEQDDWPAPPPWPDPEQGVAAPEGHVPSPLISQPQVSAIKEEVTPLITQPCRVLIQPQPALHGPAVLQENRLSQPSSIVEAQPPPLPSAGTPHPSDISYFGPRPQIRNFSRRDPSEFARLKLSLENILPPSASEQFKYQVLVDHLQLEEARLMADAYLHSPTPFTDTMAILNDKFGQPHQIALRRITTVLGAPDIRRGDVSAFDKFSLQVQSLVGMLRTLGPEGEVELQCGSHVARLLDKLPPESRTEFRRCMFHRGKRTHTLPDLSEWLKYESWCQDSEGQLAVRGATEKFTSRPDGRQGHRPITVLHGGKAAEEKPRDHTPNSSYKRAKSKPYCPFCNNEEHYLSQCAAVLKLSKDQLTEWIKANKRCWRCARSHQAAQCNLKKTCGRCQGKHLQVLHDINDRTPRVPTPTAPEERRAAAEVLYLDRPADSSRVLLKVVRVRVHYEDRALNTYAILDDGSERTMLLPEAADKLGIQGTPEDLPLRTIRQEVQTVPGASVSFSISSPTRPKIRFPITGAFTASLIGLASHTYPMEQLKRTYNHLIGLPIRSFKEIKPLLLIGSDYPHLITPMEPVKLGPPGGPVAIHTKLGWTLQGPASVVRHLVHPQQCLLTAAGFQVQDLMKNVEKLWQVDTIPFRSEKLVTRSKEDQAAIHLLETKTRRVEVDGVLRYATPLLRRKDMPLLQSTAEAVMPTLRSVERRLTRDPARAATYQEEINKLIKSGSVVRCGPGETTHRAREEWYIPHHLVSHNDKNRLVFNCSHQFLGRSLNAYLLPGPTLGASLLGVLLRFREHAVAISGDIRGMFHQVRLLPEDRALLRFIWREKPGDGTPKVYEWQVLPFGTTCSPCCATFVLQRHVQDNSQPDEDVRKSVERCFYVDNCLQSVPTVAEAKQLVDKLRSLLASAGFELRQWASNKPEVISHLPSESCSAGVELWLAQHKTDTPESTLGLSWLFQTDVLCYKCRPVKYEVPTMRNIYKVLASQYDPLGYILPYITRAKVLVRHLWDKHHGWDDPLLPQTLLQQWRIWEAELDVLSEVSLPRPYLSNEVNRKGLVTEMHVFCDASEEAYGSVAYLRFTDVQGVVHLSFLMARSRVAPKRSLSMPRLELCAALTGAQLTRVLRQELTICIDQVVLWSDSTTVLTWLKSESCRFKVFVGTRVAEIQELTDGCTWRYVDTANNPADDVTRGKSLKELAGPNRWSQGPAFLLHSTDSWPKEPAANQAQDESERRKSVFCGITAVSPVDSAHYNSWKELLEATTRDVQRATDSAGQPSAVEYRQAEQLVFQKAQKDSFSLELSLLKAGKPVPRSSRLLTLAPEWDEQDGLIRVGGRLRQAEDMELTARHPVILDSRHPATRLLIQEYDHRLHHPGSERVFAELRRSFWILRGREAVRQHQHSCVDCQRWRAKPMVPRMADLPAARLRLFKPAFYSTGMDCFGPFEVRVGRRREKRWGILFKCLTTRAVHLDILTSIDTDAFLMALRRFIARRGTPAELFSDQGTNFKGGERELREAFTKISPPLQELLAPQKINFRFNPPAAPHFGGVWEREVRSVKCALRVTVGAQPVPEEVLRTVLIEVEGILNSKPLGYVSADASDPDPVTPNVLLMGRPDGSLPQVVYPENELIGHRRWKHSQVLADHFWARFIHLYLPSLQARQKWQASPADISQDSVVMIADPQFPRALWPIGRIITTHPGRDGHVRSADVKVGDRIYTRPVAKLIALPALPSEDDDGSPSDSSRT